MKPSLVPSIAVGLMAGLLASPAAAALKSGIYQTLPGATAVENGERVTGGSRVVPIFAILTLDLEATPPSLTAVISNAVLEGGAPFPLTVRSLTGARLANGTYRFSGDYLRDLQPSGTQYGFDWNFTASTDGSVVWDGTTGWWGGHIWYVTIPDLTIVPGPSLEMARAGSKVIVSWPAAYTGFGLERVEALPTTKWGAVQESVELIGDRFSVTIEAGDSQGFFRLRKL